MKALSPNLIPSDRSASTCGSAAAARVTGTMLGILVCLGTVTIPAMPARAGTLYRWETEDGTIAFADDVKRIPERYRTQAEGIAPEGLDGYHRFTPTDRSAQDAYADRLAERLDGLRARAAAEDAELETVASDAAANPHPVEGIALQSVREQVGRRRVNTAAGPRWRRTTRLQTVDAPVPVLGVSADPDSDAPVIVERVRARPKDSIVTRHITVVRQGDRVLSMIKPRARQSSSDWPREEDLEGSR